MAALATLQVLALLVMPVVLTGVINRVKARWAGRKGAPILQLAYDLRRLLGKTSVYSTTSTPMIRIAPLVVLVTAVASAMITPLLGAGALVGFDFDFVWFAYVWGLGRVALMLGALDTGSSFEGMGAAREATFAVFVEPALFLVAGALCLDAGTLRFAEALAWRDGSGASVVVHVAAVVAVVVVLQAELARMPIDDPTTHLELTMVHEVMILDHGGRELAALHAGAAIKAYVAIAVVATLLNPWSRVGPPLLAAGANLALCLAIAVAIGLFEAMGARLKLRVVPQYLLAATVAAGIALLTVMWRAALT